MNNAPPNTHSVSQEGSGTQTTTDPLSRGEQATNAEGSTSNSNNNNVSHTANGYANNSPNTNWNDQQVTSQAPQTMSYAQAAYGGIQAVTGVLTSVVNTGVEC
jgi:hypothetical protein